MNLDKIIEPCSKPKRPIYMYIYIHTHTYIKDHPNHGFVEPRIGSSILKDTLSVQVRRLQVSMEAVCACTSACP